MKSILIKGVKVFFHKSLENRQDLIEEAKIDLENAISELSQDFQNLIRLPGFEGITIGADTRALGYKKSVWGFFSPVDLDIKIAIVPDGKPTRICRRILDAEIVHLADCATTFSTNPKWQAAVDRELKTLSTHVRGMLEAHTKNTITHPNYNRGSYYCEYLADLRELRAYYLYEHNPKQKPEHIDQLMAYNFPETWHLVREWETQQLPNVKNINFIKMLAWSLDQIWLAAKYPEKSDVTLDSIPKLAGYHTGTLAKRFLKTPTLPDR